MNPTGSGLKRRLEPETQTPTKKTITSPELAVASIQSVYTHPSIVVGTTNAYTSVDKGPFVVHVSHASPDPAAGTSIRPIKFGQFLATHKIKNICRDGVKRVGRNKISVEFLSADDANSFTISPILSSSKYIASIPTYNVTRMGLIRQVPTDLSMDQFAKDLILPSGCGPVIKARRMNRKTTVDEKISWVPTQTVVITLQGQTLPEKVYLYYTSLPVEIYQYPTIQCHNCCRYGHTKIQCRSKPRCFRCCQEHPGEGCDVPESKASCIHCSGHHFATHKNCPELERQKSIKSVMARCSISYEEARSQFPPVVRSYSEVAQQASSRPSPSQPLQKHGSARSVSHQLSQSTQSNVKTVYSLPHPRAPQGKSYDKASHSEITSIPSSSLPNGCALEGNPPQSGNDTMFDTLLSLLINIILMNPHRIPSNVALKLTQLLSSTSQYGSSGCSPVE